jgi:hypothetical protein
MDFSLDSFKKSKSDAKAEPLPEWVQNGPSNNLLLYNAVVSEYESVVSKINNNDDVSIKERKIIISIIAKKVGVDKSLISKRRKPELVEYIDSLNSELEILWDKKARRKPKSGKKLTKTELITENSRLKNEIVTLKNTKMIEYLETAIEHELLIDSRRNAEELVKLKKLYEESLETIENLRSELRKISMRRVK